MTRPLITLTTDFSDDLFAGTMKGVIALISPDAQVIDITHAIPLGDIRSGAFALLASCGYFPPGTIHVAVVDPGVGSKRRILCVRTADYLYLAPDNGLLSWRLEREEVLAVYSVENASYFLSEVSGTFHGRDIFAPVAARLTVGVIPEALGPEMPPGDIVRIEFPKPARPDARTIRGEIIYVDRFGNCISNIEAIELASVQPRAVKVEIASLALSGLGRSYSDTSRGTAIALIGSAGFLEIAASAASAARNFGIHVGDPVVVRIP